MSFNNLTLPSKNFSMEYFDHFQYMVEDERSLIFKSSFLVRITYGIFFLVCFSLATLLKLQIFNKVSSNKLHHRPINLLILTEIVFQQFTATVFVLHFGAILFLGMTTPKLMELLSGLSVNDEKFCTFVSSLGFCKFFFSSICHLGIALYRLLYMIASPWSYKIVKNRVLMCSLAIGFFFLTSLLCFSLSLDGSDGKIMKNICMGKSKTFQVLKI